MYIWSIWNQLIDSEWRFLVQLIKINVWRMIMSSHLFMIYLLQTMKKFLFTILWNERFRFGKSWRHVSSVSHTYSYVSNILNIQSHYNCNSTYPYFSNHQSLINHTAMLLPITEELTFTIKMVGKGYILLFKNISLAFPKILNYFHEQQNIFIR